MYLAVPLQFSISFAVLGVFKPWAAAYFLSQNLVLLLSLSSVLWRCLVGLLHRSLFDTMQLHWWDLSSAPQPGLVLVQLRALELNSVSQR